MAKVLVVDKDESIRKLVKRIIDSNFTGVSVALASSGQEGWREFEDAETKPVLVFTELSFEEPLAGLTFAEKIKEASPSTLVVLFSLINPLARDMMANFDYYLRKSFTVSEFVRDFRHLLDMSERRE